MRAFRLSAPLAVCRTQSSHLVVTAVNSCCSLQRQRQQHTDTLVGTFGLDSVLPADWAHLMILCRAITDPIRSFSFSSPGDVGKLASSSSRTAAGAHVVNNAYVHVVERRRGDFVPNNAIYHRLQQYTWTATNGRAVGFREALEAAQAKPAQTPAEAVEDVLLLPNDEPSVMTAAEKLAKDPLASSADAKAASVANAQMDIWAEASAAAPTQMFTFYPYPCPIAASIPYRSKHFCVMVNLKPIVPNHLMVVPIRCVGTIHGLTEEEVEDWGRTVALTIRVLDSVRHRNLAKCAGSNAEDGATAASPSMGNYSIAIQQGELAGQTVPHLHTHVVPFDPSSRLAEGPERDEDEQRSRPPRTVQAMQEETDRLKLIFRRLAASL